MPNNITVTFHPNYFVGSNNLTFTGNFQNTVNTGSQLFAANGPGLLTLAGNFYCFNTNATNYTVLFGGTGNVLLSGNIANSPGVSATNASGFNYQGTGTVTFSGTNNTYNWTTTLSAAGVLQTSSTNGFGVINQSTSNALALSNGTLGFLNDSSVTFGPSAGSAYNITIGGNAAIKVDNATYPGSGADNTTGQTLTVGSGTMGAQYAHLRQRRRLQPRHGHAQRHGRAHFHQQYDQRHGRPGGARAYLRRQHRADRYLQRHEPFGGHHAWGLHAERNRARVAGQVRVGHAAPHGREHLYRPDHRERRHARAGSERRHRGYPLIDRGGNRQQRGDLRRHARRHDNRQ